MQPWFDLLSQLTLFYLLILVGFVISRHCKRAPRVNELVTGLLINILLPVLIMYTFLGATANALSELPLVILVTVFIHISGLVMILVFRRSSTIERKRLGAEALSVTFNNGIFLPVPLILMFIGPEGIPIVALFSITQMTLFSTGGAVIGSVYSESHASLRKTVKKAVLFPPFLAAIIGILLLLFSFSLPTLLEPVFALNGAITSYLSLFAVGLGLGERFRLASLRENLPPLSIRQLLVPAATFLLLTIMPVSTVTKSVLLLEAMMPPAVLTVVYSSNFGLDSDTAAALVTVGTVLLLPVVPLMPLMLGIW